MLYTGFTVHVSQKYSFVVVYKFDEFVLFSYAFSIQRLDNNVDLLQGKGSMKTYWLLAKEPSEEAVSRCPFGSILLEELSKVKGSDEYENNRNLRSAIDYDSSPHSEMRSLYSPVSFEDVKRTMASVDPPGESSTKLCQNNDQSRSRDNKNSEKLNGNRDFMLSSSGAGEVVTVKNQIHFDPNRVNNTLYQNESEAKSQTCLIL